MAKSKAELIKEAEKLDIEVDAKSKVAEIQALINAASPKVEDAAPETADEASPIEAGSDEAVVAKAGKRSSKALAEAVQKQEKEERKAKSENEEPTKPKVVVPPSRSRLERRGKHFRKSAELIEPNKAYGLEQAIELAKKTSHAKFDATLELHVNLGVDPKHADQNIRDNLVLPAGTGRIVRVAVLTDDLAAAKKAGADLAGTDELLAALEKGNIDFDTLIATPALMARLGKYARVLGPRGLMPNPKSGTVTTDISKAVAEAKAGRVEYRVDSTGIVHLGIGKVSFTAPQLLQNLQAVLASIKSNKPQGVKGNYFKAVHLATTMGPSIKVDLASII
jgi:large subunit ribosomal protein L1